MVLHCSSYTSQFPHEQQHHEQTSICRFYALLLISNIKMVCGSEWIFDFVMKVKDLLAGATQRPWHAVLAGEILSQHRTLSFWKAKKFHKELKAPTSGQLVGVTATRLWGRMKPQPASCSCTTELKLAENGWGGDGRTSVRWICSRLISKVNDASNPTAALTQTHCTPATIHHTKTPRGEKTPGTQHVSHF